MAQSDPGADIALKTKLGFGVGNAANFIAINTLSSYALLFYNQVLGLPAHLAGLAISASLFLDGAADPIAGSLSDRTRSRLGRRHPYLFVAPIPIVLALIAVFNPPKGLSEPLLFVWFLLSVTGMRASLSFYETPHLALGGELSRDYTGRSKVMSYYAFFGWLGTATTTWIALTYFFKATPQYPRGLLNPAPWAPYSLFVAGLILIILYASAFGTRDRIPHLPQPPANLPKFSPFEFLKDLGKAFANINYVWLMIGHFFSTMMIGLRGGLHLYTNTFFWGLTSEQLRFVVVGTACGIIAAFTLTARLHKRFDKRATLIFGTILYAIGPSIPVWLGMAGIMKPGDPAVLPVVIAAVGLTQVTASVLIITVTSVLADIADENELRFGLRQEGVLYATRSFFGKIDQAIGAAFAGFVLTLIAFPVKAKPGQVPEGVLHNLLLWDGVIAVIPGFIALLFISRIRISRQSYEDTKAALAARAAAEAEADVEAAPLAS